MRVGKRERVEIRLGDADVAEDQLRDGLKGHGLSQIDRLEISSLMRVSLVADEKYFAVKALGTIDQYIRSS